MIKNIFHVSLLFLTSITSNHAQNNFQMSADLGTFVSYDHNAEIFPIALDFFGAVGIEGKISENNKLGLNAVVQYLSFNSFVGNLSFPDQEPFSPPAQAYNVSNVLYVGPEIVYYYTKPKTKPFLSLAINRDVYDNTRLEAYENGIRLDRTSNRSFSLEENLPYRIQFTVGSLFDDTLFNNKFGVKVFYKYHFVPINEVNPTVKSFSSLGISLKL